MFNEEEAAKLQAKWDECGCLEDVATLAVELVAARGGTMTADGIATAKAVVYNRRADEKRCREEVDNLVEHIAAQGARVAVLEAENEKVLRMCSDARDKAERLEAQFPREMRECTIVLMRCDLGHTWLTATNWIDHGCRTCERNSLRELFDASEEGNRELVRRAQQAEAERDAAVRLAERRRQDRADALSVKTAEGLSASEWVLRAGKAERERDEPKARCAALSAAGQVLSEHVDKARTEDCSGESDCGCFDCSSAADRTGEPEEEAPMVRIADAGPTVINEKGAWWPCSATCTHDDAATPGHAERVRERSDAVKEMTREQSAVMGDAILQAREEAAEAMRAACLKAVRVTCEEQGLLPFYERFKSAIEGAVP